MLPNPLVTTWTSGAGVLHRKVETPQNPGEDDATYLARHQALVRVMMDGEQVDEGSIYNNWE